MKDETLDQVLYELEQAESIETDEEIVGEISIRDGGYYSLICC